MERSLAFGASGGAARSSPNERPQVLPHQGDNEVSSGREALGSPHRPGCCKPALGEGPQRGLCWLWADVAIATKMPTDRPL